MKSKVNTRGLIWIISISLVLILGLCSGRSQSLSQSDRENITQQAFKEEACAVFGLRPDMLIYWDNDQARWYIRPDTSKRDLKNYMPTGATSWLDNEVHYLGESDGETFGVFQPEWWKYACKDNLIQKRADGSQWIRKEVPVTIQKEITAKGSYPKALQNGYWSQYRYFKFDNGKPAPRPRTTAERMNNPLFLLWHGACKNRGLKNLFGLLK